jgi:hypothetical protein
MSLKQLVTVSGVSMAVVLQWKQRENASVAKSAMSWEIK